MSLSKQKITIEYKYRGSIEFPDSPHAKDIFFRVKQAYANHEKMGMHLLFSRNRLQQLKKYQKGSAEQELLELDFYIGLGEILGFKTEDAKKLKESIILINDTAHTSFNITKRLTLINKKKKSHAKKNINDKDIFLAANPDSLYLKRAEWEANLYDYGKTLNSFEFIKCGHGKDVADDVLLHAMQNLHLKNTNIFILTFDRELKERFTQEVDSSNNLFILGK